MADVVTTWAGREYPAVDLGFVGDVTWETEWPLGCTTASWTVVMPANASTTNAIRIGADVQIYDGLILTWSGYLAEIQVGDMSWTFQAKGYYALADHFLAVDNDGIPTTVPSVAVVRAIADGWNVTASGLSSAPLTATEETVEFNTLRALLDQYAASLGQRWKVNERRELSFAADSTTARWHLDNGEALRSVADDDYLTAIFARYVTAETGNTATAWGVETAETMAAGNLRREQPLDLTPLGFVSALVAAEEATNRLALASTRNGYTTGLNIPFADLTTEGGAAVRLGQVKAGDVIRAYTVADATGAVQVGATQDIVIGRTAYTDGADTLAVTPVDITPRQLSTILAAPPRRPEVFVATPVEEIP